MDLTKISNHELTGRLEKLARTERKITHLVLWHINEMEARRLFAEMGYGSMYEYLTKHLAYSENSTYRRLQAARLLKTVPEISDKLESGSLNLTQLTQVQKCLKSEAKEGNKISKELAENILEKLENKSNFETQKILAVEFNQPVQVHEFVKPQRDESVRLEVILSSDQFRTLEQVRDLLSHVLPEGNWGDLISYLAEKQVQKIIGKEVPEFFEKNIVCADNYTERNNSNNSQTPTRSLMIKPERKAVRLSVRRMIMQKSQRCCEYRDPETGRKCMSTYQLQIDHRVPVAVDGGNHPENLRVLCRTHNLLEASRWGLGRVE